MSTFFTVAMDGTETPLHLENLYAGYQPSALWLVGGAPVLKKMPVKDIRDSLAPKMCINNSASIIRPDFWVGYDPAFKFLSWIFKSPSVLKFQPARRYTDRVPLTRSVKTCECPGTVFYDNAAKLGFHELLDPGRQTIASWS